MKINKLPSYFYIYPTFFIISALFLLSTQFVRSQTLPSSTFEEGFISLNFDDGWKTQHDIVLPILSDANIKATFYIATGHIDVQNGLTSQDITDIKNNGHEIGAHTRSHPHLTDLSQEMVEDEIIGSKEDLEEIGIVPTTFAYPFGEFNDSIVDVVRDNFKGARLAGGIFNQINNDPYLLNSITIRSDMPISAIQAMIDKAIDEKKWLILAFHSFGDTTTDGFSNTPEKLEQIIDYINSKNISVKTISEGLQIMGVDGIDPSPRPSPTPSTSSTPIPTVSPTPTPTLTSAPSPRGHVQQTLTARLTGSIIFNRAVKGMVLIRTEDNREKIQISVKRINIPDKTELSVMVCGQDVGQIVINHGRGLLNLKGGSLPDCVPGDRVVILNGSTAILSGTLKKPGRFNDGIEIKNDNREEE
jgi:peptidoglycan/xylan/chitin deacetylase (PgdA/CDA1 family)